MSANPSTVPPPTAAPAHPPIAGNAPPVPPTVTVTGSAKTPGRGWIFNPDLARTIPYWFIASIGLIYASGFIVVTNFLETFGLREFGTDFWKARYIHVGVLCSIFPLMLTMTPYLLFKVMRAKQQQNVRPDFKLRVSNVVAQYLVLQGALYIFVMFSRRTTPTAAHVLGYAQLGLILLLTILSSGVVIIFERFLRSPGDDWKFPKYVPTGVGRSSRVILLVLSLVLFGYFAWQYKTLLVELLAERYMPLLSFVVFMLGICVFPSIARWYSVGVVDDQQTNINLLTICVTVPLYYFGLMAFSASAFSYIPATRGGGDYTVGPVVVIKLKPEFTPDENVKSILEPQEAPTSDQSAGREKKPARGQGNALESPAVVMAEKPGRQTRPCILIEELSTGVFVAAPEDGGGPAEWRRSQSRRPNVVAISRDMILAVSYLSLESMEKALPQAAKRQTPAR